MDAEAEGGAGWQREWIQQWVQVDITSNVAGLWGRGVLIPLRRLGGKIRPTALNGVMLDAIFETKQFSVRTPGGAEAVIGELRQRSMSDP